MLKRIAALAALALLMIAGPAPAQDVRLAPAQLVDLVAANRILVDQAVIDVRGHVSVRDPADPNRFWITRAIAPGLATAADMQAFDLDGKQVGGAVGTAYTERFIHARIYKARPDVNSVVHAHTPSLITFSVSGLPIRPVSTSALFAAAGVPVHVNGRFGEGIYTAETGDALARTLGASGAVLMQGHGAVIVGASIQSAVGRSVGLDANAKILISLLAMGAKPVYLEPPPQVTAGPGDYAREWSWWVRQLEAR